MAYGTLKVDTLTYNDSGSDVSKTVASLAAAAPTSNPTFTGTVTIPTAAANDNSTKAASTAYVQTELGDYALKASPTFTGTPTLPTGTVATTQATSDNTTKLATTAFVQANVPTSITVANEATDTTCFPLFATAATGDLAPKTVATLSLNSNTGALTAGSFVGNVTGNLTGTIQTAAQTNITSLGTLSAVTIDGAYKQVSEAVSALNIDCSTGNYFTKTIAGNSTFTFSNPASSGTVTAFTLELTHSSGTVTWPSSVKWSADTAPTLTAGKTHLFMFVTDDGGTRYRGSALVDYVN